MPGIQLPIGIDTVNPVPADFKYGPYASTAAAIAAIPQVLRFDGLTVKITGLGEYWWLAADLTNTGLIPKTGGGGLTNPVCTLQMQKTFGPVPLNTLGTSVNFTRLDNTPSTDIITSFTTEFSRDDLAGALFNSAVETVYTNNYSPANTQWNSVYTDAIDNGHGNIQNVTTRVYGDFETALNNDIDGEILTTPLVMHDSVTDKYYLFTVTQWTNDGAGGGFAYTRTEVILGVAPVICDGAVNFDDGSSQDQAAYSQPRTRYVYLVQDDSDVSLMGGVNGNTYKTIQAAWDASYAIILANPTYNVVIKTGVISSAAAGSLNITSANNSLNIFIQGISPDVSQFGNILATTPIYLRLLDITCGNIVNNSLVVFLGCSKIEVGNISSNGLQSAQCSNMRFGDINLSSGTPVSPIPLQIYGSSYVKMGDVVGTNITVELGTPQNGPNWNSHQSPIIVTNMNITNVNHFPVLLIGVTFINDFTYTANLISLLPLDNFKMDNVKVYGITTINRTGNPQTTILDSSNFEELVLTGSTFAELIARDCDFKKITDVPDNTIFMNCTVYDPLIATPAIDGIGTSCEFYNTSIVGGSLAIDNAIPVSVKFTTGASAAKAPMGANITLT